MSAKIHSKGMMVLDVIVLVVAGCALAFAGYQHAGRPVVEVGASGQIMTETVYAGDIVGVLLPIKPLRDCTFNGPASVRVVRHLGGDIVDSVPAIQPEFGPEGEWNEAYQFRFPVPPTAYPGNAQVRWRIQHDCMLRSVYTETPWIKFVIASP